MAGTTESLDLGPVSAYAIAVANGYTGTEEQFAAELANASANAQAAAESSLKAEGYSTGKQDGVTVSSGEYFQNNADYYNQQAQSAKTAAETAASHYPVITDGYWYVWDTSTGQYVNTNVEAKTVTFTPAVSAVGVLSWTNNGGLENPSPINIKGDPGSNAHIHICSVSEYDSVSRAPTILQPDETIFYLVPSVDGDGSDMYTEWIYTNNTWEIFGSAKVDLSDYATKAANPTAGNFASLDANGNLTDSGHKHSDYLTEHQSLSDYVRKADYASSTNAGVVKVPSGGGISLFDNQYLAINTADDNAIKNGSNTDNPIAPAGQHKAVFYGLAKAAGDTTQYQSGNEVGTYTSEAKTAIQTMLDVASNADIPNVPVQDVQINGISVLSNGIANMPLGIDKPGVVRIPSGGSTGISISTNGELKINSASINQAKEGTNIYRSIVPSNQHASSFYGLAKAAGDTTQALSSNAVGTYTDAAKTAIRNMLDVPSKAEVTEAAVQDVRIDGTTITSNGIADISVGGVDTFGVVKAGPNTNGVTINASGAVCTVPASDAEIQAATVAYKPIAPSKQHQSVFFGLAKAAGDTTQVSSSNAVGTYTDGAKTAIKNMLGVSDGAVQDVQIDGSSILSNGVANIPVGSNLVSGVLKTATTYGTAVQNGIIYLVRAISSQIKEGSAYFNPIVPNLQHESVFYGLAKAAGTDMASSSNEVGTYTAEAQAAIRHMLGVETSVDLSENVSGTDPVLTCQPNVRYTCGEVLTISITPPVSGSTEIIFQSGSTPAVLTVPSTVKFPSWFDSTSLDTDTTYYILITDGIYGTVMTWDT